MFEGSSPEMPKPEAPKEGKVRAVLETLKSNRQVQVDMAVAGAAGVLMGIAAPHTGLAGEGLGGFLGSMVGPGLRMAGESARRAEAVAGHAVDRAYADSRHFVGVLVDAVKSGKTQMPTSEQMDGEQIRVERYQQSKR